MISNKLFYVIKKYSMHITNFKYYVFDLDNTLYSSNDSGLSLQITQKITNFIIKKLNISFKQANILRKEYYHRFGTTMHGLIYYHNIDPNEYFNILNNLSLKRLKFNNELINIFNHLKTNRKKLFIFTNSSRKHAKRIIKKINLDKVIDDIVTLECTKLIPKPNKKAYKYFFNYVNIIPNQAVFFEDSVSNLITAKFFGMTTVLIYIHDISYKEFKDNKEIDYLVKNIESFFKGQFLEYRK